MILISIVILSIVFFVFFDNKSDTKQTKSCSNCNAILPLSMKACPKCNTCLTCKTKDCPSCPECKKCPCCPPCEATDCPACPGCPTCPGCEQLECPKCPVCPDCPECELGECPKCPKCPKCPECNWKDCKECEVCKTCPPCEPCKECENCKPCEKCPDCPPCPDCKLSCKEQKECCANPGEAGIAVISIKNEAKVDGTLPEGLKSESLKVKSSVPGRGDVPYLKITGDFKKVPFFVRYPDVSTLKINNKEVKVDLLFEIISAIGKFSSIGFTAGGPGEGLFVKGDTPTEVKIKVTVVESETREPVKQIYGWEVGDIDWGNNRLEYVVIDKDQIYTYGINRDAKIEMIESEDKKSIKWQGMCENIESDSTSASFMFNSIRDNAGFIARVGTHNQDGTTEPSQTSSREFGALQTFSGEYKPAFICKKPKKK